MKSFGKYNKGTLCKKCAFNFKLAPPDRNTARNNLPTKVQVGTLPTISRSLRPVKQGGLQSAAGGELPINKL